MLMEVADKLLLGNAFLSLDAAYVKMEKEGGLIPHGGAGVGFASAVRLSQTCVTRRIQPCRRFTCEGRPSAARRADARLHPRGRRACRRQCARASGARLGGKECENQDRHCATAVGVGADRVGWAA